ncbi:MAG TPA: hypothetical protein VF178_11970, partial [Gemmatimonadaceae bacterium]
DRQDLRAHEHETSPGHDGTYRAAGHGATHGELCTRPDRSPDYGASLHRSEIDGASHHCARDNHSPPERRALDGPAHDHSRDSGTRREIAQQRSPRHDAVAPSALTVGQRASAHHPRPTVRPGHG